MTQYMLTVIVRKPLLKANKTAIKKMGKQSYFFLVGAPKCGTTSVAEWLNLRQNVCVSSVKEPTYFTDFADRNWTGPGVDHFRQPWTYDEKEYNRLYRDKSARWRVDASTDYLHNLAAFERIRDLSKRCCVKVAVITRNPVDRALSQYKHTQREGYSSETLYQALEKEKYRIEKGMHPLFWHIKRSQYFNPIKRYYEEFGENFMVMDYHNIENEINRIPRFLDIPFTDDALGRENSSKNGYHPFANKMLRQARVRRIARYFAPIKFRDKIKDVFKVDMELYYNIDEIGLINLREALEEEIEKCIRCKEIPTTLWKT